MVAFPLDKLQPRTGSIRWSNGDAAIEIPLEPFALAVDGVTETIDTVLSLDWITLPTTDLAALAGQAFDYPINPDEGYIDGSIHIGHAHHPVDVTQIRFGALTAEGLEAEFDMDILLEFEGLGDYADTFWVCQTLIRAA